MGKKSRQNSKVKLHNRFLDIRMCVTAPIITASTNSFTNPYISFMRVVLFHFYKERNSGRERKSHPPQFYFNQVVKLALWLELWMTSKFVLFPLLNPPDCGSGWESRSQSCWFELSLCPK